MDLPKPDDHVDTILAFSSRSLHPLRLLRAQGLPSLALHIVTTATVALVSSGIYAHCPLLCEHVHSFNLFWHYVSFLFVCYAYFYLLRFVAGLSSVDRCC